jgi:hypothetical protein
MHWGDEVWPYPVGQGHSGEYKGDQGGGHGRERSSKQYSRGGPECERQGRVTDGDDVAVVERYEIAHVDPIDRAGPPRHHEAEEPCYGRAGKADGAELDGQPAGAGDALGPRQTKGSGLQLTGDEGRPPEDPDDARHDDDKGLKRNLQIPVVLQER